MQNKKFTLKDMRTAHYLVHIMQMTKLLTEDDTILKPLHRLQLLVAESAF